jgi:hypothetical protein
MRTNTDRNFEAQYLAGADGVVDKFDRILCWDSLNHPVCSVANAFFVAATPPNLGGECADLTRVPGLRRSLASR